MTMCSGGECPLKSNCIRCTGVVYGRTDFFGSPPFDKIEGTCEHFVTDRPKLEDLARLAYDLWENSGCKSGLDESFWIEAENMLIEKKRNS